MREIKKKISRGLYDKDNENPFELFVSSTEIRWCYYKDSKNILGQTYGMLVLQDFESMTANLLCRTIETVEGGGIITILLKNMTSLKQFYSMVMVIFLLSLNSRIAIPSIEQNLMEMSSHDLMSVSFSPYRIVLLAWF